MNYVNTIEEFVTEFNNQKEHNLSINGINLPCTVIKKDQYFLTFWENDEYRGCSLIENIKELQLDNEINTIRW